MGRGLGDAFALGVGVGRGVAVAEGVAVDVAVAVGVGVGEIAAVAVAVAVAVGVGLIVAVAVGVGVPPVGTWIVTFAPPPFLKKATSANPICGGAWASNRKLYNVPQRIAFAFWFCANVSLLHSMFSVC